MKINLALIQYNLLLLLLLLLLFFGSLLSDGKTEVEVMEIIVIKIHNTEYILITMYRINSKNIFFISFLLFFLFYIGIHLPLYKCAWITIYLLNLYICTCVCVCTCVRFPLYKSSLIFIYLSIYLIIHMHICVCMCVKGSSYVLI